MTEFLQNVLRSLDAGKLNVHWKPISYMCDPCTSNYRYVLRQENPEEINYLLHLVNETHVPVFHKSLGSSKDKSDLRYYDSVPLEVMNNITEMYKLDFELFEYDETFIEK